MVVDEKPNQILIVKDISDIIVKERQTMQAEFSQKLTASLCHEIMTPLNCIINVSEILLMQSMMLKPKSLTSKEKKQLKKQYRFIHSLASSAKFMRLMLCS